jgi:hypothetical protein
MIPPVKSAVGSWIRISSRPQEPTARRLRGGVQHLQGDFLHVPQEARTDLRGPRLRKTSVCVQSLWKLFILRAARLNAFELAGFILRRLRALLVVIRVASSATVMPRAVATASGDVKILAAFRTISMARERLGRARRPNLTAILFRIGAVTRAMAPAATAKAGAEAMTG